MHFLLWTKKFHQSALLKIRQIPHVIFQTTGQFSSNFSSNFVMRQLLCTFLAEILYTFKKKGPIQVQIW